VHAHCTIPEVSDLVKDTPLASNAGGRPRGLNVMGPDRVRAIDELGVDVQVLSINGFLVLWIDRPRLGCKNRQAAG